MTADLRAALRTLALASPAGAPVTFTLPREDLLELVDGRDGPHQDAPATAAPAAPDEPLLTAREAAERLRVPVGYLYRHPRLPFLVKVGRKVRVSPSRLARYLERRT